MLKQAIGRICRANVYSCEGNRVLPWFYVPSCFFHNGQVKSQILPSKSLVLFLSVNYLLLLLEFLIYLFYQNSCIWLHIDLSDWLFVQHIVEKVYVSNVKL